MAAMGERSMGSISRDLKLPEIAVGNVRAMQTRAFRIPRVKPNIRALPSRWIKETRCSSPGFMRGMRSNLCSTSISWDILSACAWTKIKP
jgi:hypothetical protein